MHPPELVVPQPARIEALFTDYLRRRDGGEALALADFAREHADCAPELARLERNWRRVAAVLELLTQHDRRAPRGSCDRRARDLAGPAPGVPVPADRRGSVSSGTSGASAQDGTGPAAHARVRANRRAHPPLAGRRPRGIE